MTLLIVAHDYFAGEIRLAASEGSDADHRISNVRIVLVDVLTPSLPRRPGLELPTAQAMYRYHTAFIQLSMP